MVVISNLNIAEANATKTMTVTIGEGGLEQSNLSKVVNILNLKNIVKVTLNTGTATHTISGNSVTLNVSGGIPARVVNNPRKYSKIVADSLTSNSDNFANSKAYNVDGFSTSLPKDGVSRVIRGTYTPSNSKYVVNQSSPNYRDSQGYEGKLTAYEVIIDEDSCEYDPETNQTTCESWSETRFKGTVTKPALDTRVWQQDYKGTAYKSGNDNYYKYTVTIEYIDNINPILTLSSPYQNSYFVEVIL